MEKSHGRALPLNVQRSAQSRRRSRDRRIVRGAMAVLVEEVRQMRQSPGDQLKGLDLLTRNNLERVRVAADIPLSTWYRCMNRDWSGNRLNQELDRLAAVLVEERRVPTECLVLPEDLPDPEDLSEVDRDAVALLAQYVEARAEDWMVALALHAARAPSPNLAAAFPHQRWRDAPTTAALIDFACLALTRTRNLDHLAVSRVERYHGWLEQLLGDEPSALRVRVGERRAAGLLDGLRASGRGPMDPGPRGDEAGYWAEGVITALVKRGELQRAWRFVRSEMGSSRWSSGDGTVLNPLEFMAERLAVRVLEETGPAKDEARRFGRKVARELGKSTRQRQTRPEYLVRRLGAVRSFLEEDWHGTLIDAVASSLMQVRSEVEEEYAFPLLAFLTHRAAENLGDQREPFTAALLRSEIERGRGPFNEPQGPPPEPPAGPLPSLDSLRMSVEGRLDSGTLEELSRATQRLSIAWAFNTASQGPQLIELVDLVQRLRKRRDQIEAVIEDLSMIVERR